MRFKECSSSDKQIPAGIESKSFIVRIKELLFMGMVIAIKDYKN
jgi:hypothetical protein